MRVSPASWGLPAGLGSRCTDLAARSASLGRIYQDLGFEQLAREPDALGHEREQGGQLVALGGRGDARQWRELVDRLRRRAELELLPLRPDPWISGSRRPSRRRSATVTCMGAARRT